MNAPAIPAPALDPETAAFIQRFVSMNLATTDAANRPAVARVFGCRVAAERSLVTLFMCRTGNDPVMNNIRANGRIAVVFSRPSTHRTVQLKGDDARVIELQATDRQVIAAYRESTVEDLGRIGYPPEFTRSLIPAPETPDTAICFTPLAAYSQTPGPHAGRKLTA